MHQIIKLLQQRLYREDDVISFPIKITMPLISPQELKWFPNHHLQVLELLSNQNQLLVSKPRAFDQFHLFQVALILVRPK